MFAVWEQWSPSGPGRGLHPGDGLQPSDFLPELPQRRWKRVVADVGRRRLRRRPDRLPGVLSGSESETDSVVGVSDSKIFVPVTLLEDAEVAELSVPPSSLRPRAS